MLAMHYTPHPPKGMPWVARSCIPPGTGGIHKKKGAHPPR